MNSLYPPSSDYHALHKVWLKLDEKCRSSSLLKILTSELLQSAPNDPKLDLKNQTQEYTLHMQYIGP